MEDRIEAIKQRKKKNRLVAIGSCMAMLAMLFAGSAFVFFSAAKTEDEPARVARKRVGQEIEWIGTEYTFNNTRARVAFGRIPGNRHDVILRYDELRKEWWIEDENIY